MYVCEMYIYNVRCVLCCDVWTSRFEFGRFEFCEFLVRVRVQPEIGGVALALSSSTPLWCVRGVKMRYVFV